MIQLLTTIPKQLLPALGIPLVELFPDLCLGWWTPPSLNLNEYNRRSFLRILLQIIAWYPVSARLRWIWATSLNTCERFKSDVIAKALGSVEI